MIFVSHDLDQIADTCDRVMWLQSGQLNQVGAARQVLEYYLRANAAEN